MFAERMCDLVSRYRIPTGYVYRITSDGEYLYTRRPLEVSMCDESF